MLASAPGVRLVDDGDELELDYDAGRVRNLRSGAQLPLARFPATVEQIYELGGIFPVIRRKLMAQGIAPDMP